MTKWIVAERARTALQHAVICPSTTLRTKEKIAQSKRGRTGLLATVDKPKWRELVSFLGRGRCYTPYLWRYLFLGFFLSLLLFFFVMSVHKFSDLTFVDVNDAVEAVGLRKEDLMSSSLYDLVGEESEAELRSAVDKLKASKGGLSLGGSMDARLWSFDALAALTPRQKQIDLSTSEHYFHRALSCNIL